MSVIVEKLQRTNPEIFQPLGFKQMKRCSSPNHIFLEAVGLLNLTKENQKPELNEERLASATTSKNPVVKKEPVPTNECPQWQNHVHSLTDNRVKETYESESEKSNSNICQNSTKSDIMSRCSEPIYFLLNDENPEYDLVSAVHASTEGQKNKENIGESKAVNTHLFGNDEDTLGPDRIESRGNKGRDIDCDFELSDKRHSCPGFYSLNKDNSEYEIASPVYPFDIEK